MTVAQNGITAIAKQLIEARCNVELQQYDGATPLYMAAFFGHPDVTEQLIEAHVNIDLEHENGYTPLMIPAYRGHAAAIIGTVGIERLRGWCKGRLGAKVWMHEDFHSQAKDEEEEEEEDSSDVDSVEEDQDEEEEEPLSDQCAAPSATSV